jgi:N utilization substance protein B
VAETETGQPRSRPNSGNAGRVKARRCAVQALYQWQVAGATPETILAEFLNEREVDKVDVEYFAELARDIPRQITELRAVIEPLLDRPWERVGPVERSVLLIGAYELKNCLHIPYRVVVNEGIELSKMFGADEAHRYINGVLDRLARSLREVEISAGPGAR